MKALILAGGKGTRFLEETKVRPKPMIEINNKLVGINTHLTNKIVFESLTKKEIKSLIQSFPKMVKNNLQFLS